MAEKREGAALRKFKEDLAAGTPGPAYIFCGEETYLRSYYLSELRRKLIPAGFEEFNDHTLDGKTLTAEALAEVVEAMPMMAERTLTVVTDWDIFKLGEDQREKLIALLSDLPDYGCLVFVYDTVAYKPNRAMKKLCKAISDHVEAVEFAPVSGSDLVAWVSRRFRALDKDIDRQTAEYLIFTCGSLMTGLVQEIGKIALRACIFDGNLLEITVRDWGCGIADVEKAREPLYTTGGEERSGMGFTIMESFMDSLAVRSKNGKGTVVTMKRRIALRTARR